ncbi:MAG: STAS domain-containing protein [Simkaniaceae bacterium]|nr:STAS domain-containing protein [Candidatus Sacchlamyda saccharinae]
MGIGVEITAELEGDIHVVTLDGRIDAATTPVVEKKLANLLEASDKMAIDCSGVDYLSSAGMRLFLSMTKKMAAKEGKLAFFGMTDDVMEIIKMAGFERILKIFSTKKEALKHVS